MGAGCAGDGNVVGTGGDGMMNALHLLWIVPLSATIGFSWGAFIAGAKVNTPFYDLPEVEE